FAHASFLLHPGLPSARELLSRPEGSRARSRRFVALSFAYAPRTRQATGRTLAMRARTAVPIAPPRATALGSHCQRRSVHSRHQTRGNGLHVSLNSADLTG